MDPLLARALAREMDDRLRRARVRALLLEPEGRRTTLFLRDHTLVFEMHPSAGWVSLLEPREPLPPARPLASRIHSVTSLPDESALVLGLQRVRGRDEGVELVLEYVGNRWNAVVVGHRTRTIRHVLVPRPDGPRPLAPGHEWTPPPRSPRVEADDPRNLPDPGAPSEETDGPWTPAAEQDGPGKLPGPGAAAAGDASPDLRRRVLRSVAWTSSVNVHALVEPPPENREELARRIRRLTDPEGWGAWLVAGKQGPQPYPVPLPPHPEADEGLGDGGDGSSRGEGEGGSSRGDGRDGADGEGGESAGARSVPTLLDAMARAREAAEAGPTHALLVPARLLERADRRTHRLRGRLRGLEKQLGEAGDPEPVRALGDLLLARFHQVRRGAEEVELEDFEGQPVTVELDPALSPQENAARYYDEAARLERVREELPDRVRETRRELEAWTALVEGVREGSTEPEELARTLGPDPRNEEGRRKGTGRPTRRSWRRYRSSNGLEIRVGRGAQANDDLTFRNSAPDDIWMHVREAPGAHVILRWGRSEAPPPDDLAEAAILAALHSEARGSGTVPVDWTWRKHVRKPRKAPPGAVVPDRVRTVFVEPDPKLEARLADPQE